MTDNGLSYLKAIGIRVHTVRYQKTRKRIIQKDIDGSAEVNPVTSKEYKRIRGAFSYILAHLLSPYFTINLIILHF